MSGAETRAKHLSDDPRARRELEAAPMFTEDNYTLAQKQSENSLPIDSNGNLDEAERKHPFRCEKGHLSRCLTRLRIDAVHAIQSAATQKSHNRSDNSHTRLNCKNEDRIEHAASIARRWRSSSIIQLSRQAEDEHMQ